ncbi:MAG: hypothetical protein K8R40_08155 [Anaerolineaceae bacterium]|nr:hypothetical protein [Anaerolineaceae bacterium]
MKIVLETTAPIFNQLFLQSFSQFSNLHQHSQRAVRQQDGNQSGKTRLIVNDAGHVTEPHNMSETLTHDIPALPCRNLKQKIWNEIS